MPKDKKGAGVKLTGNIDPLLKLMIPNREQRSLATDMLVNEGPEHKQVLSALLLKRLYKLVQVVEKSHGHSFTPQKGYDLDSWNDEEEEFVLPVKMPLKLTGVDKDKIVKAVGNAPGHEALAYAMALQVIEWSISEMS